MNIIRTRAIELTIIPAIAYKQKMAAGGAGIKILRIDNDRTAFCHIDKHSGALIPHDDFKPEIFPREAFREAAEMTAGLPYSPRGKIKISPTAITDDDVMEQTVPDQTDMTLSAEYAALVGYYLDDRGRINYQLMNRDFIKFASRSRVVANMTAARAGQEEILVFIVRSQSAKLAKQKESPDAQSVLLLIETLEEINPRRAFKELRSHINRLLAKQRGIAEYSRAE